MRNHRLHRWTQGDTLANVSSCGRRDNGAQNNSLIVFFLHWFPPHPSLYPTLKTCGVCFQVEGEKVGVTLRKMFYKIFPEREHTEAAEKRWDSK